MQTITKQYNVYEFDELTEDIKEKVIEKFSDINLNGFEDYFNYDEYTKENLKNNFGLEFDKIYYDLDYRNRHLYFNKIWVSNIKQFIKAFKKDNIAKKDLNFSYKIAKALKNEDIRIYFENSREKTFINFEDDTNNNITAKYPYLDNLQDWFNDKIVYTILKNLQKDYNYQTSKDAIIDTIKANEYKFLENGVIF